MCIKKEDTLNKKKLAEMAVKTAESILENEKVQKIIFGEYSDGIPRNLPDALLDETKSPKQKAKKKKKKKNKKKHKKHKDRNDGFDF